jgi:uncharacterized protein (DUF4213/DUF364 family)
MKSVNNEIVNSIKRQSQDKTIEDLRIGLCYTAILLDNGDAGLAYTFHSDNKPHSCCNFLESGSIKGNKAQEIINFSLSDNLLKASVGIATINALVNQNIDGGIEGDILNVMNPQSTDTVGMVGFFGPLVDPLKKAVKEIYIFEKEKIIDSPDVYPTEKTTQILPRCSIVIISATTLINKTIDSLLSSTHNAREIVIVGATTPFLPHVFSTKGVTMLSGTQVVDSERVLQIVSEGGGMRSFKNSIKKVNVLL